jgi:hypothetical protein
MTTKHSADANLRVTASMDADGDVEQWLDDMEVDPADARDARHMRAISAAAQSLADAQTKLSTAVDEARRAGDTWAMIGTALGITRQAAFQRFGHGRSGPE